MTPIYPPAVDQLLTLGRPSSGLPWADYRSMGLAEEHVPALLELLGDERLSWEVFDDHADETPFWAKAHAWRALGQLRADAAIEPLIHILVAGEDDDWATSDIPQVLGMIGPAALPSLRTALPAAARGSDPWPAITLATALREIGARHPEAREQVVEALVRQLKLWEQQDAEVNGFLVHDLVELRATEAAPVMQEAFEAEAVDELIIGDWEEVQVALGLLAERKTPPPRFIFNVPRVFDPRPAPVPGATSAAARSRQLRKTQKQAKKRRRK
ncbi:MAG TPA: hypothetical protein VEQ60_29650 [Longimicrobium sp.]|nr:hypothetical protein [Longimicrobium sp.]